MQQQHQERPLASQRRLKGLENLNLGGSLIVKSWQNNGLHLCKGLVTCAWQIFRDEIRFEMQAVNLSLNGNVQFLVVSFGICEEVCEILQCARVDRDIWVTQNGHIDATMGLSDNSCAVEGSTGVPLMTLLVMAFEQSGLIFVQLASSKSLSSQSVNCPQHWPSSMQAFEQTVLHVEQTST